MTDNDIIKALESCGGKGGKCEECPYENIMECDCEDMLLKNALDLINRQKAENERLMLFGCQVEVSKKIEKQIKSEAIKEFAERFEYFVLHEDVEVAEHRCKDYESYFNGANQFRYQIKNVINNLVKEMVGDTE